MTKQIVGQLRQFTAQPKVSGDDIQRHIGPDRQDVRIHHAARAILRICQDLSQTFAVVMVHRVQDLTDDRVGQVIENVGKVIQIERASGGNQISVVSDLDQMRAHLVVDVNQNLAFVLWINQLPYDQAPIGR